MFSDFRKWLKTGSELKLSITILAISILLNGLLTYELSRTRHNLETVTANRKLTIGESAPGLIASDWSGKDVEVRLANHVLPTVVYLYSASCHWYEKNLFNVQEMVSQSSGKFEVILISMEPRTSDRKDPGILGATHLFSPSIESKMTFDFNATPMTLVFSPDGVLQKVWKGAFINEKKIEIEKTLGIHLSDLDFK